MAERVLVYSTDFCPYCTRAKLLLKKRSIPYTEIDVSSDSEKRAWLVATTRRRTVPQIFIDGQPIGGSDELHELDRSGKLSAMMARAPSSATSKETG